MRRSELGNEASPGRRPRLVPDLWIDGGVAVCLVAVSWLELATRAPEAGQQATTPVAYLLVVLVGGPYAVHRRRPGLTTLVTYVALLVYSLGHFNAFPGYAAFALVFGIALHAGRQWAVTAYLAGVGTLTLALAAQPAEIATTSTWVSTFLALTVAWLAGESLRARRERRARLVADAERAEREREDQARRAVVEERLRIARDMHDVVAHSMSVIAVQAGVANHVIDQRPEQARQALATIETTSRQALVEMRWLVGVLREGASRDTDLIPAQRLSDLPQLVDDFDLAGLRVEVRQDGAAGDLPAGLDLTAYRIVQEGLTNVLRHGGPVARVSIGRTEAKVLIEIRDDGRVSGHRQPTLAGPGHGLSGMRERVAMFGGRLDTGHQPDGGFALRAELPLDPVALPR